MADRLLVLKDYREHTITSTHFETVSRLELQGGSWFILATGSFMAVADTWDNHVSGIFRLDYQPLPPPYDLPPPAGEGDEMEFFVGSFILKSPSGPAMDTEYYAPSRGSFTLVMAATVPYEGGASGSVTGPPPPPPEPPRAVVSAVKHRYLSEGEWVSDPGNILVNHVRIVAHEVDKSKKRPGSSHRGDPRTKSFAWTAVFASGISRRRHRGRRTCRRRPRLLRRPAGVAAEAQ